MGKVEGIAGSYKKDEIAEIIAKANPEYKFSHWSGDGVTEENKEDNPLKIPVTKDLEITANFIKNEGLIEEALIPIEDTHIMGDWGRGSNYNNDPQILVKANAGPDGNLDPEGTFNDRKAFFKFDISDWTSAVSAEFKIYAEQADWDDAFDLRTIAVFDVTGEVWDSAELTWDNAPESLVNGGTLITQFDISGYEVRDVEGKWYSVDLTDLVKQHVENGASELSIRLEGRTGHHKSLVYFTSSEGNEETRPQLIVFGK